VRSNTVVPLVVLSFKCKVPTGLRVSVVLCGFVVGTMNCVDSLETQETKLCRVSSNTQQFQQVYMYCVDWWLCLAVECE